MSHGFLYEAEHDFNEVDDINGQLNVEEVSLHRDGVVSLPLNVGTLARLRIENCPLTTSYLIASLIDRWEDKHDRCHDQVIDGRASNQEVPELTEVPLGVDQIPLDLGLRVNIELVVLVVIVLNVIYHHLPEVLLCHLLQPSLEPELIVVTLSLGPQVVDPLLTSLRRHVFEVHRS